jgi:CheY-like chemotaxis protein
MASVGGIPLVERIRMRYSQEELPIILTSASGKIIQQNEDGLYTAFLTKPIKQSKLLETVLQIVQGDVEMKSSFGNHEGDFAKKHLKILIAYDNDLTRAVTEKNLTIFGHTCTSVLSGVEALRHLKKITNEDDMPLVFGLAEEQAQGRRLMKQAGADEIIPTKHAAEDIQKKIEEWFEK